MHNTESPGKCKLHTHNKRSGERLKQPAWFHAANFWQTFNSFCCFPSQHIYLCNVTRSREGVRLRGGGRGEKLFYRLPAPPHMLLLYKGCLESQLAALIQMLQANTHTHTLVHTIKNNRRKGKCLWKEQSL